MPERDDSTFWSYQDLFLLIAAILPSLLIGTLLVRAASGLSKGVQTLVLQSTFFALLLAALYLLVAKQYGKPFWRSMGWFGPVPAALWCAVGGPVLAVVIGALGVLMRAPEVPDPVKDLITGRGSLVMVMVFAVVFGPIYEELLFRGFLFPLLRKSFGATQGIILSALPFALLHGAQYQWAWQQITLVGIAGAVFGFVRQRTGSTAASTILHSMFNATQFVAYLITLKHYN